MRVQKFRETEFETTNQRNKASNKQSNHVTSRHRMNTVFLVGGKKFVCLGTSRENCLLSRVPDVGQAPRTGRNPLTTSVAFKPLTTSKTPPPDDFPVSTSNTPPQISKSRSRKEKRSRAHIKKLTEEGKNAVRRSMSRFQQQK